MYMYVYVYKISLIQTLGGKGLKRFQWQLFHNLNENSVILSNNCNRLVCSYEVKFVACNVGESVSTQRMVRLYAIY